MIKIQIAIMLIMVNSVRLELYYMTIPSNQEGGLYLNSDFSFSSKSDQSLQTDLDFSKHAEYRVNKKTDLFWHYVGNDNDGFIFLQENNQLICNKQGETEIWKMSTPISKDGGIFASFYEINNYVFYCLSVPVGENDTYEEKEKLILKQCKVLKGQATPEDNFIFHFLFVQVPENERSKKPMKVDEIKLLIEMIAESEQKVRMVI